MLQSQAPAHSPATVAQLAALASEVLDAEQAGPEGAQLATTPLAAQALPAAPVQSLPNCLVVPSPGGEERHSDFRQAASRLLLCA